MKKLFFATTLLVLMLSSCMTTYHWNLGQTTNEFFAMNEKHKNKFILERSSTESTIYRVNSADNTNSLFFYFKNDKLVQVDRGQRPPDVIIQNR